MIGTALAPPGYRFWIQSRLSPNMKFGMNLNRPMQKIVRALLVLKQIDHEIHCGHNYLTVVPSITWV